MELKEEYIKRIDEYLIRMGFEYTDIRYEIIDHIAAEIEENISDIDGFFTKNGLRGEFLMYMLSKDEKLTKSYEKLIKKRSWYDQISIIKKVAKEFMKIKKLVFILLGFLSIYYLAQYDVKIALFTVFGIIVVLFSSALYVYYGENKKFGKLKVLHSYSIITAFLAYCGTQSINARLLIARNDRITIYEPLIVFVVIVLQTLVLIVFLKHKTTLHSKYKHLITS